MFCGPVRTIFFPAIYRAKAEQQKTIFGEPQDRQLANREEIDVEFYKKSIGLKSLTARHTKPHSSVYIL